MVDWLEPRCVDAPNVLCVFLNLVAIHYRMSLIVVEFMCGVYVVFAFQGSMRNTRRILANTIGTARRRSC